MVMLSWLIDRLIEERWLNLLDVPQTADDEVLQTSSPDPNEDRRDAWIVMGGSLLAAVALCIVTTLGVPLTAGIPAAFVFLMGPAVLMGSRKLGASPRGLLTSVRSSVEGGGGSGAGGAGNNP
ncbi:hypothetical protein GCM10012287_26730 [Streptomyces daqingensis]|uniref:Uncharacterized protein n=1 Tax=Streptomyces daqingensis TaxID=1472640 RepID=A0ABQ2MC99_9ACTN|nr:hypothetical protein GCM10012287_26730 [Streptomyces daqingensis]